MAVNRLGPPCPECGSLITRVVTTARSGEGGFYRRRHCQQCDHRFHTAQPAEILIHTNVFVWTNRNLQIDWQHPDLLSKLRSLITKVSW